MDSKEMLDKRIVQATRADTILGMVLEGSLNHLVEAYGASIVNPIRKQVMEGGDKAIRSFFWYPVGSLLKVVRRLLWLEWALGGSALQALDAEESAV